MTALCGCLASSLQTTARSCGCAIRCTVTCVHMPCGRAHTHALTHMCMHVPTRACAFRNTHTPRVHTHTRAHAADTRMHTGAHTYTYVQMCVRIRVCYHTYTGVSMHVPCSHALLDTCRHLCGHMLLGSTRTCSRTRRTRMRRHRCVHVLALRVVPLESTTYAHASHARTHTPPSLSEEPGSHPQLRGRGRDGLGRRGTAPPVLLGMHPGISCHLAPQGREPGRASRVPEGPQHPSQNGHWGFRSAAGGARPSLLGSGLHRPAPPRAPRPVPPWAEPSGARPGGGA